MIIQKSTIITLREDSDYYYTVEDVNIDVGCDGITVSYREDDRSYKHYITFSDEIAEGVAEAILKLIAERKNKS